MRILGYPDPIGIDSFGTYNFSLMTNLLRCLASLYDPGLVIIPDISNENGRFDFIKSNVQQMAIRSGIRLNPKKLYSFDRFGDRELLKISAPIYSIITSNADPSQQPPKQVSTKKYLNSRSLFLNTLLNFTISLRIIITIIICITNCLNN